MNSPPPNSLVSLVATALISLAVGVVSTAYIMKRHSLDNKERGKSVSTLLRSPSSDCSGNSNSNKSDNGDEVAPLEKMQKRLSMPRNRRSILLSPSEEGNNSSRSPSPRRLCSSLTKEYSDTDSHDSDAD
eukprot:CAMPEP_0201704730 /NCGR_PEP_ID=MMETSP0578-20130828/43742_1 /ASSEMBLY_ACC=CAM_ASM_000663 /TAXON_ID=267565 /ORGANISM="Skeletonema grethea, Strain CCMP 1804" /LENGTH=129 /DNA_ID=CAMNT_0048192823 /DNA_START=56 /DNA_END=442 /DNA_ORIENTATION=+